ncbi:hypothetical protein ALQ33_101622 [Pseudomonas syringae pv. philadelphi]|uniref:Uncharacterized protein n=1 Tax=Pseudomonas syringae pv. philadelphi TaxID=251706 RepID=A0A3M3YQ01_9PSED|nr:hypothetical protein ALQ33_101622 [Pseudomonas syringae pv. philadelphi]
MEGSMWQYLQMVSGTENAINELSSVGNRYRDDWGLAASAWIVRPPSSSRRGSTFRGEGRSREPLIYSIFRPSNALEALIYQGATAGF